MQKITPFLWFDGKAEEAMNFYVSTFKGGKVLDIRRYGKDSMGPEGTVMTATFEIEGQAFTALNGGPVYRFTPAVSFFVECADQAEVDRLWSALAAGGEELQCGWITDAFGVTWQIVPKRLGELLQDADPERAGRALQAMLQMKKIDVAALEAAADGSEG